MDIIREKTRIAKQALNEYLSFSQEKVDHILLEVAKSALFKRSKWAKLAHEETQLGIYEDKIVKNHLMIEQIYDYLRDKKTVGIIKNDKHTFEIAEPCGVLACFLPCTNPTSSTIFKILTAIKTRNPIIFSPHPRSIKSTIAVCNDLYDSAIKAGAPKGCLQYFESYSREASYKLMKDENVDMIWATGGSALVKAAFSSGKPCIAGGGGNVPSYIESTANIEEAVYNILMDKMFDWGSTCTSTKGVVVDRSILDEVKRIFRRYESYFLDERELSRLENTIINPKNGSIKREFIAISAKRLAEAASISVPNNTKVLIATINDPSLDKYRDIEVEGITSFLKFYVANSSREGIELCARLINHGGLGHTANLYTNNNILMEEFSIRLKVGRVNINMPSTFGAATNIYTDRIPTFSVSCGTYGNNTTTDNLNYMNLLNIKRVAKPRSNLEPFRAPKEIFNDISICDFFKKNPEGQDKKVLLVTDPNVVKITPIKSLVDTLSEKFKAVKVFSESTPDPSTDLIKTGVDLANQFKPDIIVAAGGGSPIDCAKLIRLCYDVPNLKLEDLYLPFMELSRKIVKIDSKDIRTKLICIPTTVGTGSEMTCAAVVTDLNTKVKYPIFDHNGLFADTVILDRDVVKGLPSKIVAETGFDALVHAIEAYLSTASRPSTDDIALRAIKSIYNNIIPAYRGDADAKYNLLKAASDAGIAITNAFVGVNHSLAHQLGGAFGISHGAALAVFFVSVIKYNATMPFKMNGLPTYARHQAPERYARIANIIGHNCSNIDEAIDQLIDSFKLMMNSIGLKMRVSELGIDKGQYEKKIPLMAQNALLDICNNTNPRYVLTDDLIKFFEEVY